MQKILLFTAVILIGCAAKAQSSLGLRYGLVNYQRQDQLFSPLVYQGPAPLNLGLQYQRLTPNAHFGVDVRIAGHSSYSVPSFDYLSWRDRETVTTPPSTFWLIDLDISYLRRISRSEKPLQIYAGLSLDNQIAGLFYAMGSFENFGYTTACSLSPIVSADWQLSKRSQLSATFNAALLSWLARPPYAINDDDFIRRQSSHRPLVILAELSADGKLTGPAGLQRFQGELRYRYRLNNRWTAALAGEAAWISTTQPKPLKALQSGLNLGISYNW